MQPSDSTRAESETLFRELTDNSALNLFLEGFNEIGETVLVGPNEVRDNYTLATSFFQAATELKKLVLEHSGKHLFRYEYPMLFLYRHALELYIKSILPMPRKGHNLGHLLSEFISHMQNAYRVDISDGWFVRAIKEVSTVDPSAQSFRYPKALSGTPTLSGDYVVNVKAWGEVMDRIAMTFLHLHMSQLGHDKSPVAEHPVANEGA